MKGLGPGRLQTPGDTAALLQGWLRRQGVAATDADDITQETLLTVLMLSPEATAAERGLSVRAVYVAKSQVIRRRREELHGLLD